MITDQQRKTLEQVVAAARTDDGLRRRLLDDSAAVLKEYGLVFQPGFEIKVVADTDKVHHVVLPPKAKGNEFSDADLERVAAGSAVRDLDEVGGRKPRTT